MKTDTQRTLAAGILIFFLSLSFLATPLFAMNKKVFIIASYEENHICGGPQEEGVVKGLNKEGKTGCNRNPRRQCLQRSRFTICR